MSDDELPKPKRIDSGEDDAQFEALLRQAPPGTVGVDGSVVNDLALAIGCYIATGSYVGELVGVEDLGNRYVIPILCDPNDPTDVSDFERFKNRISEITGIKLSKGAFQQPPHIFYELEVPKARVASLAAELVRSPGTGGWGKRYEPIKRTFGDKLQRIAKSA